MMQKKLLMIALCGVTFALSGCATDGNRYRSDVYTAGMVNQAQEVKTVEIIAINPAQVAVVALLTVTAIVLTFIPLAWLTKPRK